MVPKRFSEARSILRRRLSELKRDEDGGTNTIEFVLWLPIFILILSVVVDVCFMFLAQAVMYDVASDTARRVAVGTAPAAARAQAQTNATFNGAVPTVTIDDNKNGSGVVEVVISHNVRDVDVVGVFGSVASTFASDQLSATVLQVKEREGTAAGS